MRCSTCTPSTTNSRARARWRREPPLALIRLQWWREVVEGARRRHEVAEPLAAALEAGALDRGDLLALIDARETEVEPAIETLEDWRDYVMGNAGGVAVAAGRLLGAPKSGNAAAVWCGLSASPACCAAFRCTRGKGDACCLWKPLRRTG